MDWIDVYGDKRRFELKEGNQVFVILQLVDNVYVCKDCITKLDFFLKARTYMFDSNELSPLELIKQTEIKLLENWVFKAESLSKAVEGLRMGRSVIVTDYAIGQVVYVVEFARDIGEYVVFQAKFKGVCHEGYELQNMFESLSDRDIFMEPKDSDKIFVRHDAAVKECDRLNESLREKRK